MFAEKDKPLEKEGGLVVLYELIEERAVLRKGSAYSASEKTRKAERIMHVLVSTLQSVCFVNGALGRPGRIARRQKAKPCVLTITVRKERNPANLAQQRVLLKEGKL